MIQGLRQAFFLDFLERSAYIASLALTAMYLIPELASDSGGARIRMRLIPAPS
jgi:hypothetical protein